MIDLIFIGIIAVFISGMLWSDRDSRRVRWYERDEIAGALLSLSKVGISAAKAAENLRRNMITLSTPTGSIFYDQAIDRSRRDKESNWNTDKQDPIKDINDMATECGWPTIPTESEEQ